jgi:DegV family protein with EDD domain
MSSFVLSCGSTADLTKERFESRDIHYICFHYQLNGKDYPDDLGQTMPMKEFYDAMAAGGETSTSQPNISDYLEYFIPFLEAGKDILHVELSSGLSGAVNSARNAAAVAVERYPDRKVYIVDSLAASSGFGLLVETLADMRDKGMSIDQVRDWAEENKLRMHLWFFSTDLTFYVKGGRVTKAAGWFGTLLNICPLLNMDNEGRLRPRHKIRGKQAVIRAIVDRMEDCADGGKDYNGKCYLCHSACEEDARQVIDLIKKRFPNLDSDPELYDIGTTIGSHTGPGTVAVFFWGKQRTE